MNWPLIISNTIFTAIGVQAIGCGDSVQAIYRANFAFDLAECLER